MKKYFNWKFIKSPQGHRLLLLIALAGLVIWYIFRPVSTDTSKDALIQQMRQESDSLKAELKDEADFRNIVVTKIETLQESFNQKQNDKTRIYERIENNIHHYDTASLNEIQGFFNSRYPTIER